MHWTVYMARRLRCPLDYVATSALVAIGSVLASRVCMHPRHYNPWKIAPNLWGGIIGDPGRKKSPAVGVIFKAVDRLKIDPAEAFKKEQEIHKKAVSTHSAEIKLYREACANCVKNKSPATADERDIQNSINSSSNSKLETRRSTAPQCRRFRLNDPTIEAVQVILKDDPMCMLIDRDELTGMLAQWEMEGHQNDRPFYLESANGLHPYDGARIGRGDFFIRCLCLSFLAAFNQPSLAQYPRNPKVCLTVDGALQRLQLLVYPKRVPPLKPVDMDWNTSAKNRFFDTHQKLAHRSTPAAVAP